MQSNEPDFKIWIYINLTVNQISELYTRTVRVSSSVQLLRCALGLVGLKFLNDRL